MPVAVPGRTSCGCVVSVGIVEVVWLELMSCKMSLPRIIVVGLAVVTLFGASVKRFDDGETGDAVFSDFRAEGRMNGGGGRMACFGFVWLWVS